MSAPFIGSRISLISKSDVRYEGILCGIDTNESKVYLQHVRCFGTEDRRKENPIAPATEVYEVIIFHSSDIKDLSVCELPPPVAYDPMSFNSFSHMGSGYPPQYGYPPMVHPQYGPQYGYPYGPYGHNYGMYPQSPSMMGPQDSGAGFPPGEQGNDKPAPISVQPPQKINVTTTKVETSGQAPSSDSADNNRETNDAQSNNADNNENAKAEVTTSDDSHSQKSNNFHNKNQNNNQNKRNNNNRNNNFVYLPKGEAQRNNQAEKSNDNSSNNNAQQTDSSSAPSSNADHQNNRHNNHNNQSDYRQKRGNSNNRGYKNYNNNRRGGFDSRSHHNPSDQSHFHNKPKEQTEPRSQEDFDFLISNSKFEKLSISALPVCGELEKELPKVSPSYNKDSFYDSISCDTLDREDQKDKKSYYEQRKLDSETFGDIGRRNNNNNNRGRTRGRYDSHSQNNQNNYSGNHSNNQKRYNNNYNNNRGNRNYRGNKNMSGNTSNTSDNTAQN